MKNKTKFLNLISMSSYSILERTDAEGKADIIYDNSFNFAVRQITKAVIILAFLSFVIIVLCRKKKRSN